jgi:hypothetical protein
MTAEAHCWCWDRISGWPDHYIIGCVECGEHMNCPAPCSETATTPDLGVEMLTVNPIKEQDGDR